MKSVNNTKITCDNLSKVKLADLIKNKLVIIILVYAMVLALMAICFTVFPPGLTRNITAPITHSVRPRTLHSLSKICCLEGTSVFWLSVTLRWKWKLEFWSTDPWQRPALPSLSSHGPQSHSRLSGTSFEVPISGLKFGDCLTQRSAFPSWY